MLGPYDPDRNEPAADDGGAQNVSMIMMLAVIGSTGTPRATQLAVRA